MTKSNTVKYNIYLNSAPAWPYSLCFFVCLFCMFLVLDFNSQCVILIIEQMFLGRGSEWCGSTTLGSDGRTMSIAVALIISSAGFHHLLMEPHCWIRTFAVLQPRYILKDSFLLIMKFSHNKIEHRNRKQVIFIKSKDTNKNSFDTCYIFYETFRMWQLENKH